MATLPIVTVNITLRTATVSAAGFGTTLFLAPHRAFTERVRSYEDLGAVGEDFSAEDAVYKAARAYFSNNPRPAMIKIGRVEGDGMYSPQAPDIGELFEITISVGGEVFNYSYTAVEFDSEGEVVNALLGSIQGEEDLDGVVTASADNGGETLKLVGDGFTVKVSENIIAEVGDIEGYVDALSACIDEDDDFYSIAAATREELDILAIAGAVQTMSRLYFIALGSFGSLTPLTDQSSDVFAKLKELSYSRTVPMFSQIAGEEFPEMVFVGSNATYSPDEQAVVWAYLELAGVPLARNAQNRVLNTTERKALDDRNVSFVARTAAGNRLVGGKTSSGAWVDDIQNADAIEARVLESLEAMFLNQQGRKVVGGAAGKLQCEGAVKTALEPFIASQAINSYVVDSSRSSIDFSTRTLKNLEFSAELTGAILRANVNGSLEN